MLQLRRFGHYARECTRKGKGKGDYKGKGGKNGGSKGEGKEVKEAAKESGEAKEAKESRKGKDRAEDRSSEDAGIAEVRISAESAQRPGKVEVDR